MARKGKEKIFRAVVWVPNQCLFPITNKTVVTPSGGYQVSNQTAPGGPSGLNIIDSTLDGGTPGSGFVNYQVSEPLGWRKIERREFTIKYDGLRSPCPIPVSVDIKPGSCPNPLNVNSKGVLPAAIMGTPNFDVTKIDPASIKLAGVSPVRSAIEDVGAPFEPFVGKTSASDCNTAGSDGTQDLTLKFDTEGLVAALGTVQDNEVRVLKLTGSLKPEFGSTPIGGEDVIVILKKK